MNSLKKLLPTFLLLLLLADFSYSFYQYFHSALGGEVAQIVALNPNSVDARVLEDPLGLSNQSYTNPNRFFAHWTTSNYLKYFPLALQNLVDPIESVYLSVAIAKMLMHLTIVFILTYLIHGKFSFTKPNFLLTALLITALFQSNGFNRYMGIIDQAVVYAFAYALPLCLFLVFILPQAYHFIHQKQIPYDRIFMSLQIFLIPVLALNGPLSPAILLLTALLYFFFTFRQLSIQNLSNSWNKRLGYEILLFSLSILASSYSLSLAQNNALNPADTIPVLERYQNLPQGVLKLFSRKVGPILLLLAVVTSYGLLKKYRSDIDQRHLLLFKYLFFFSILYLFLLPLGGYREYRPLIIRYDTFMPITIALIFLLAYATRQLLSLQKFRISNYYLAFIIAIILIFSNADRLNVDDFNCEYQALKELSKSKEEPVILNANCTLMEWQIIRDPEKSQINAELFHYWNITSYPRKYYQK